MRKPRTAKGRPEMTTADTDTYTGAELRQALLDLGYSSPLHLDRVAAQVQKNRAHAIVGDTPGPSQDAPTSAVQISEVYGKDWPEICTKAREAAGLPGGHVTFTRDSHVLYKSSQPDRYYAAVTVTPATQ